MSRYTLTARAETDITGILQFIAAQDGEQRALGVYEKFLDAFELLGESPALGKHRNDLTDENVRWWPVSSFLVVYDAERSPIDILRVIHGARNLPQLFQR